MGVVLHCLKSDKDRDQYFYYLVVVLLLLLSGSHTHKQQGTSGRRDTKASGRERARAQLLLTADLCVRS